MKTKWLKNGALTFAVAGTMMQVTSYGLFHPERKGQESGKTQQTGYRTK